MFSNNLNICVWLEKPWSSCCLDLMTCTQFVVLQTVFVCGPKNTLTLRFQLYNFILRVTFGCAKQILIQIFGKSLKIEKETDPYTTAR